MARIKQKTSRPDARLNTEMKDEDIGDDEEGGTEVTLDSMTRQINQNMRSLGSNNPFIHEKVVKPGSKAVILATAKSGALTHRVRAKEEHGLAFASHLHSRVETKKNYVVLKNPR